MSMQTVRQLIGDYEAFYRMQVERSRGLGIETDDYPIGHLALRTHTMAEYEALRDRIERHCVANVENVWSGRPISKLLLRIPLRVSDRHSIELIELVPPPHRPGYAFGLEHIGFVVGADFDSFLVRHRAQITTQQDQGPFNQPLLITFDDSTSVKFHRHSLADVVRLEGHRFDGFHRSETGDESADGPPAADP
jgi:predicted metalloenzyme YecM